MLKELIKQENQDQLIKFLEDTHAHDLSEFFVELEEEEKAVVYQLLSDEKLAELVTYLESEDAADVLVEFDIDKQKQLIEMMEPDDAADIIQELDDDEQNDLLEALGKTSDVAQLIHYDEDETGSAMTNLVVILTPNMEVKQATKKVIQEAVDVETINTLFVVDEHQTYLGVVPLKKLIKAKTPCYISELIEQIPFVYDSDSITQTLETINNYGIFEMPVCNENHQLLGMITLDDALDIYQEEAQEDFERLAGLPETINRNAIKTAFYRLPWLLLLLAISVPIALVTSLFEEVLTTVAILIVFQPLILGSAGNVATQTLAVTLKMYSTNESGFLRNSIREILTGMMNGFIIGLIAFVMTLIFAYVNTSLTTQPFLIAFVVGVSLWLTVLTAPMIAIVIPSILRALKFDPAVASGPFITTLIDIAALLIYFGLATLMLGGI